MWIQTNEGLWRQCSTRSPETLLILAAPEYQAACLRLAGRNLAGLPRLRLVWAPSAFTFAGGHEVHFWDDSGNEKSTRPTTVFVPKYHMPAGMENCFVLEEWKSPEYYGDRARFELEYSQVGEACRQLAPVTNAGGYEAVEMDMAFPVPFFNRYTRLERPDGSKCFAAPMTVGMVEHVAQRYFQLCRMQRAAKDAAESERLAAEEAAKRTAIAEEVRESFGPYAHGMIAYSSGCGPKMPEFEAGKLH